MNKVFTTVMPDKIGAFLKAAEILNELKINILRVSYNKAVDSTMLFIEASGDEGALCEAEKRLEKEGYIKGELTGENVILMEFYLSDEPGALLPVLSVINEFKFNISYINSRSEGTGFQNFKMGLLVSDEKKFDEFKKSVSELCPIRVINYKSSEKALDNTVFYVSFVNDISKKMSLSRDEKRELLINSNLIMQLLEERNLPPFEVFGFIGKFSEYIQSAKGEGYIPRITHFEEIDLTVIEPPCGSNVTVFNLKDKLLFVDAGFNCYKEELFDVLRKEIPDFDKYDKEILLTHSDVDHIGFLDEFKRVYLSENTALNLINVSNGKKGYREEIASHSPYVKISKILSGYRYPTCKNFKIIGKKQSGGLMSYIGSLDFGSLSFEVYEGSGGHVRGETVFVERKKRFVLTGDIFINIKDCIKAQSEFNKIAPYLMSSVDSEPELAARVRREIKPLLDKGKWLILGGHGAPCYWDV
ncbi:MAG: Zn-dependent hydrolase [Ruminococcaceae bacterium]|nr:Zn-dependent hydrolase [Oscillospiraceae bacterium]